MATQTAYSNRFIGRQKQLKLLTERYHAAGKGEGSVVIVAGEAGAGKTRLVSEFCSGLPALGARYAVGRCLEYIQLPYAPFLAVLGAFVANDPAVLSTAPHIRAALANLVPELQSASDSTSVQPLNKLRQFNMMADALQRFGSDRPVVAIIEDLHWADSGTLELLLHLLSYIAASHVLLIVTYRNELLRDHPLRAVLAKLERHRIVWRTNLEPLDSAQMHSLILHALEKRDALAPRTINAICARAEGNPLFAEELLKSVLVGVDELGRHLPSTVQEAVRDRLRGTSDAERSTLAHAAALGRRFKADFLADILGQSVEQISPALRRALDLGLIVEETDGAVYYGFKHELQRQAIYGELLAAQAQRLHRKIALALEASNAEVHTVELAYHWWQAHEPEKAARYNERAGDAAFSIFAYGEALINYERALKAGLARGSRLAELKEKLSNALNQCGFGEQAKEAALASLTAYESAGEKENAARVCLNLAQLSSELGDTVGMGNFARRALQLIGSNVANPIFFAAHVELLVLHYAYRWDLERALEHMAQAERFTGTPQPAAQIRFLTIKAAIAVCSGKPHEALGLTKVAAELAAQSHDVRSAIRCWGNLGAGMAQLGESELALQGLEEALRIMRDQKVSGLSAYWVLIDMAQASLNIGDLNKAREFVEQALAADVDLPTFRISVARTGILVGLRLELNDLIERCLDADLIDYALRSSEAMTIGALAAFAEYYAAQGRHDDARLLLHRALDALERIDARPGPGDIDKLVVSVACHGDEKDLPRAGAYLERIVSASSVRATPACLALFCAYRYARERDQDPDGARANAKALEAARLFREIGWPDYEARALELAGEEKEALEIYRRTGDLHDTHRLEAKLVPVNRRGRSKNELTARECEILALLATGKSNKAIAAALVISERTVENHVSAILGKLGAASRAELIAKTRNGNVPPAFGAS